MNLGGGNNMNGNNRMMDNQNNNMNNIIITPFENILFYDELHDEESYDV